MGGASTGLWPAHRGHKSLVVKNGFRNLSEYLSLVECSRTNLTLYKLLYLAGVLSLQRCIRGVLLYHSLCILVLLAVYPAKALTLGDLLLGIQNWRHLLELLPGRPYFSVELAVLIIGLFLLCDLLFLFF
jgi:hypothetical protein